MGGAGETLTHCNKSLWATTCQSGQRERGGASKGMRTLHPTICMTSMLATWKQEKVESSEWSELFDLGQTEARLCYNK